MCSTYLTTQKGINIKPAKSAKKKAKYISDLLSESNQQIDHNLNQSLNINNNNNNLLLQTPLATTPTSTIAATIASASVATPSPALAIAIANSKQNEDSSNKENELRLFNSYSSAFSNSSSSCSVPLANFTPPPPLLPLPPPPSAQLTHSYHTLLNSHYFKEIIWQNEHDYTLNMPWLPSATDSSLLSAKSDNENSDTKSNVSFVLPAPILFTSDKISKKDAKDQNVKNI